MLGKLALLLQGKLTAVALGALVVTGAGTAVTVAATHGKLPVLSQLTSSDATPTNTVEPTETDSPETPTVTTTPDPSPSEDHTVAGVLVSYDAQAGAVTVNSDNAKGLVTVYVNADTKVVGDHVSSLADLANALNHRVEVSTTVQSDGSLLAVKVAVGDEGSGDQPGEESHVAGTVASVGADSFTVTLESGATVTVSVSSTTSFSGSVSGLSGLATGMNVEAEGAYQTDGSFAAATVKAENPESGDGGGSSGGDSGGSSGSGSGGSSGDGSGGSSGDGSGGSHSGDGGSSGGATGTPTAGD